MTRILPPFDAIHLTGVYRDVDAAHADGLGSARILDLIQHGGGTDCALIAATETSLTLALVNGHGRTLEIATAAWLLEANRITHARAQAAGMHCSDIAFRRWLRDQPGCPPARTAIPEPERTAIQMRAVLEIPSRKRLSTDAAAATRWDVMQEKFERAVGRINDPRQ